MIGGFLLALREGLEAALIVGVALGVLKRVNRMEYANSVWAGVWLAVAVSAMSAFGLYRLGVELEGTAEEIFEGLTMLLAAGVLTWMIFWMQQQAVRLRQDLEAEVSQAAVSSGHRALFALAFIAVAREGIELALFLTAASFSAGKSSTWLGALSGLLTAGVLGWGLYASTLRLDLGRFFQATSVLLLLFAAGLIGHGVHEFIEVGWIPPIVEHLWDINPFFDEKSTAGSLFTSLFGYNGNPSMSEVMAYLSYLGIISFFLWDHPIRRNRVKLLI